MKRALALGLVAAAVASTTLAAPASAEVRRRAVVTCPSGPDDCWPVSFDFIPGGRGLFYVERFTGEIRRFLFDGSNDALWADVDGIATEGEQGLLGIQVDPRWNRGPKFAWIYVYYTRRDPLSNVIVRLRKRDDGTLVRDLLARIPAASGYHNGGVIEFGPDGMLYAATGDAHRPARAQDRQDPAGKVLRMTKGGNRPRSNPFAGSLAWSFGHRNSFGLTFDRRTDRLWHMENGPECDDEISWIRRGRNYGWGPASDCPNTTESGPNPTPPEKRFTPPIAITGGTFCGGCDLGAAVKGDLVFGAYNDGRIRHAQMRDGRTSLGRVRVLYSNGSGVVGVEAGPGGDIFFSDRNGIYRLVR